MKAPSIFNDIIGPVMRGPSSSHTAGSFHIARLAGALLGARPVRARFAFDPNGSYAQVYRQQGVDRAYALGLLGWPLTDGRFFAALDEAAAAGVALSFAVEPLEGADHPNTVDIELESPDGTVIRLRARSVGGGAVELTRVEGWPVRLTGETFCALAEVRAGSADAVMDGARVGRSGGSRRRIPGARRASTGRRSADGAARCGSRAPACGSGPRSRGCVRRRRWRSSSEGARCSRPPARWSRSRRKEAGRSAASAWPTRRTCSVWRRAR